MPDDPKTFTEMLGEALREVAVLVIVFVPLDVLVSGRHFTWIWFLATVGISAPLFLMGVVLEKMRAQEGAKTAISRGGTRTCDSTYPN